MGKDELFRNRSECARVRCTARTVYGRHENISCRRKSRGGSDGPPARVIERTASIAAYFSKAKHSSLVPVIYTQRKYVRKFRGARPGQVTCEREKMVMVPPLLPDGAGSSS